MRTAIRYWGVLGTIGLTELLAHFLSLGWGIMTLLAAFAWVALSGASTAAKARSTEDRVNALVPVVGTAYQTANTAHTVATNAQNSANTAQGTADTANNNANTAQGTADTANNNANTALSRVSGLNIPVGRAGGLQNAPSSYTSAWGNSVVSFCTQLNNQLGNAGIFN